MKFIKLIIITSIMSMSFNALAYNTNDQTCSNTNQIINRDDVDIISNDSNAIWDNKHKNFYVKRGEPSFLKAKQNKQLVIKNKKPFISYVTTRDFYYFENLTSPFKIAGPTPDENLKVNLNRGVHVMTVVALDDELKIDNPFGGEYFIPICDVIKVYSHNSPIVDIKEVSTGDVIGIELNVIVDSLSRSVQELGGQYNVSWKFINETSGVTESVITTTDKIYFSPRYNGHYIAQIIVSDGVLSSKAEVFIGLYDGGIAHYGPTFEIK